MPKPTSHTRTDAARAPCVARAACVARASSPGKPSSITAPTPGQASAPDASNRDSPGQDGLAAQTQLRVDLRRKVSAPHSSVASGGKPLKDGKATLMVGDDELEGEVVSLVVLDGEGRSLAKAATVIGGD